MTAFYLASRVSRAQEMSYVRTQLEQRGHNVTSRWIDLSLDPGVAHANRSRMSAEQRADIAKDDLHDIRRADVIILASEAVGHGAAGNGRLVEYGYALGRHKECWVVGPLENLFLCLPNVLHFKVWDEVMSHVDSLDGDSRRVARSDGAAS